MLNLTVLDLHDNRISDLSPLKNLVNLMDLDLDDNQISDISSLNTLTNLTVLDLDGNKISNISTLSRMLNLTELDLHDNRILDISPLKNLVNLTVLDLSENYISDFSPIAGLIENLTEYNNRNQSSLSFNTADVNRDGIVNIIDILLVSAHLSDPDFADIDIYPDVNDDGVVDVKDLVAVAAEIDADAAAPTLRKKPVEASNLTAENLGQWIQLAKHLDTQEPHTQNGIAVLEQLLTALTLAEKLPEETALLANYPNPFNPETWMPYQLAKPAEVNISIHSVDGKLIRTLELGHLPAGIYHNKSRAAYWDGRNKFGESVASGVYFYTFTIGGFTATRKMIIRK